MLSLPRLSPAPPIAVELGGRRVHAVQTSPRGRVLASLGLTRPVPGAAYDAAEAERVVRALRRRGFRGRRVALTAPKPVLTRSALSLPPADSGAPIAQIARAEVARLHETDPDALECALFLAPQDPGTPARAVAVACEHHHAAALLDAFDAAGCEVEALLPPSVGLAAAAEIIAPSPNDHAVILDLGWSNATLTVAARGEVVFERDLPGLGTERLVADAADKLGVTHDVAEFAVGDGRDETPELVAPVLRRFAERLREELALSLDYVRSSVTRKDPAVLALAGAAAADPELDDWLVAETGLAAVRLAPDPALGPAYAVALGVAARLARRPRRAPSPRAAA